MPCSESTYNCSSDCRRPASFAFDLEHRLSQMCGPMQSYCLYCYCLDNADLTPTVPLAHVGHGMIFPFLTADSGLVGWADSGHNPRSFLEQSCSRCNQLGSVCNTDNGRCAWLCCLGGSGHSLVGKTDCPGQKGPVDAAGNLSCVSKTQTLSLGNLIVPHPCVLYRIGPVCDSTWLHTHAVYFKHTCSQLYAVII